MKKSLKSHFPIIRSKEEVRLIIRKNLRLEELFQSWTAGQQEEFLDFCSGNRGVKILYDSFFKEILNPENAPERLNELLSLILRQQVKILQVLPNDSTRIADESSLVIMDIVVELEDHSIANVEVQKIGYKFSGQRSACYSADLLLRQYKRVRGERGRAFSYRDIHKVYTIVFFEQSPESFRRFKEECIHHFTQVSDTGAEIELLQEFCYVCLDIFRDLLHNKGIRNKLDAWLTFLSVDDPEAIEALLDQYPEFGKLYQEIYELCRNVERVMGMFSEELRELDRNTVQLMIDEMQEEIDALRKEREEAKQEAEKTLARKTEEASQKDKKISEQEQEIAELKKKLAMYEEHGND
ncbi:PD-(D/E)XK nuclease family transposase [Merdimonas faecis]|uniref:PD-(D/E)XK nuclease family transposase n=1 Tax=Merdimonas faecis TaxID=1653435 RepID=UPI0023F77589|nr:PD-(D/E)XK nuclease family transposase [Merdimonas faecis]